MESSIRYVTSTRCLENIPKVQVCRIHSSHIRVSHLLVSSCIMCPVPCIALDIGLYTSTSAIADRPRTLGDFKGTLHSN